MLDFQPHDFPFDGDELVAHTLTQAKWEKEVWDIGVGGTTRKNGLRAVWCRKQNSPLLTMTGTAHSSQFSGVLGEVAADVNADAFGLRMIFADVMAKEKWGRALFLNERLELRQKGENSRYFLLLSGHGWGVWRDLLANHSSSSYLWNDGQAAFTWSQENEHGWLYKASAAQILARVKVQLSSSDSDMAFAQTVCSSSFDQRRQIIWPCKRGDILEMQRVLRWALMAQEELWTSATRLTWHINLHENERGNSYLDTDDEAPLPPSLKKALFHVLNFFEPEYDAEPVEHHLCQQIASYGSSQFIIWANTPSAHERLEAALEWRDWLATNYPDQG